MKTKTRNIKKGVAIFIILLSVSFIAGCYLKNQSEENADYLMPEQTVKGVTQKDITDFMSSVKVRDGQAESNYKLGLYFQEHKRHKLAVEEFNKALVQQPDMALAYNAMGISYDKLGKPSQALHCYQLAIKLDPQMDSAYNNLGYSYLLEDQLDAAIATFQKAIELNDQNKRYRNNLGLAYVMKGDYHQAKEQFKMLDNESGAEQKLASLLYKLGKVRVQQEISGKSKTPEDIITADSSEQSAKPLVITKKIDTAGVKPDTDKPSIIRKKIEAPEKTPENSVNLTTYEPDQAGITIYGADTTQNENKLPDQPITISAAEIVPPKNFNQTGQEDTESLPEETRQTFDANFSAGNTKNAAPEITDPVTTTPEQPSTVEPETHLVETRTVIAAAPTDKAVSNATSADASNADQMTDSSSDDQTILETKKEQLVDVEIVVANGNGEQGMARRVGNYLESRGFKVAKITNANSFDHAKTKLFYSNGRIKDVRQLVMVLSGDVKQQNLIELKQFGNRIKIIIGKDMAAEEQMTSGKKNTANRS